MSNIGFKYCSLLYLNQWLSKEREYCEALASNDESERLKAIRNAATFYGIARNLPTVHDTGAQTLRYNPVLDIMDAQSSAAFQGDSLISSIESVRKAISSKYGGRDVLALTTKLLWIRFKSPIIIYDSQVRTALRSSVGDTAEYYKKWRDEFNAKADIIEASSISLQDVHEYAVDREIATPEYIARIASQEWFKERVLDIYLWHLGRPSKIKTAER